MYAQRSNEYPILDIYANIQLLETTRATMSKGSLILIPAGIRMRADNSAL